MSRRSRGHDEGGHEADERWVISYADLVTLLFGFFIILYATADANEVKFEALARGLSEAFNVPVREGVSGDSIFEDGSGVVPAGQYTNALVERDLDAIRQLVEQRSIDLGIAGDIAITREEDGIVLRLAENLIFPSASADIRPEALPVLSLVAEAVLDLPNEIRVEGHTDNVPVTTDTYPSNWELSAARATAVLRHLVDAGGLDPERVFAAGYGEYRPVAENLTPEGRAVNRRADIVILYPVARIGGGTAGLE
ncbi:MAG: OmpA family protein [Dehalococcoidia bacterium]|nr:OmpA family protein [Dehalococcoidia bacterium]